MKKIKQFFEHKYSWGARGVSWPLRLTCFALSFMAIRMDWQSFRAERGFLATRMDSLPFQHIYRAANHWRCNSNWKHMAQKESGWN